MSPWQDGMAQFLAFTIAGLSASEEDLHVLHNMADVGMDAPIAVMPDRQWYPVVDTADSVTTAVYCMNINSRYQHLGGACSRTPW